jgi:hypothetical protein
MPAKTFTIEIRTDHDTPDKDETMRLIARTTAKHLLTQALLLQDKRPPQVSLQSGDMFEANTEVMLADDMLAEEPKEDAQPAEGARTHNAEVARVAGYTVSDKGDGWRFNDPDGKWSEKSYQTEAAAWEGAFEHHTP